MSYEVTFKTIWANFDPNRHMRHTAYSDYAAEVRARYFLTHDLSLEEFAKMHIGPVIFKEETSYFKEIKMGTDILVTMELVAATPHLDRWEFEHQIFDDQGNLSAKVKVYGAWFDLQKRKLTTLPDDILQKLQDLPKSKDFKTIERKAK